MAEAVRARVEQLLADDPVCGGCVAAGTVDAIVDVVAPSGEAPPLLFYAEAKAVGERLHDHWRAMAGKAPMRREDFGWADLVQQVLRLSRDAAARREEDGNEAHG